MGWQSREVSEDLEERLCPGFRSMTVQERLGSLNMLSRKILGLITEWSIYKHG